MNPTSLDEAKDLATVVAKEATSLPGEAIIFPPRGAGVALVVSRSARAGGRARTSSVP